MAKRTIMAAGNWKMNKTPSEAKAFVEGLRGLVADAGSEVVVGVPAVCLPAVVEAAKDQTSKWPLRMCTGRQAAPIPVRYPAPC